MRLGAILAASLAAFGSVYLLATASNPQQAEVPTTVFVHIGGRKYELVAGIGQEFSAVAKDFCASQGLDRSVEHSILQAFQDEHANLLQSIAPASSSPKVVARVPVVVDQRQLYLELLEGESAIARARDFLVANGLGRHEEADSFMRVFVHKLLAATGAPTAMLPRLEQDGKILVKLPVTVTIDGTNERSLYNMRLIEGESVNDAVDGFISRLGLQRSDAMVAALTKGVEDALKTTVDQTSAAGAQPHDGGGSGEGSFRRHASNSESFRAGSGAHIESGSRASSKSAQADGADAGRDAAALADVDSASPLEGVIDGVLYLPVTVNGDRFLLSMPLGYDPQTAASEFLTQVAGSDQAAASETVVSGLASEIRRRLDDHDVQEAEKAAARSLRRVRSEEAASAQLAEDLPLLEVTPIDVVVPLSIGPVGFDLEVTSGQNLRVLASEFCTMERQRFLASFDSAPTNSTTAAAGSSPSTEGLGDISYYAPIVGTPAADDLRLFYTDADGASCAAAVFEVMERWTQSRLLEATQAL